MPHRHRSFREFLSDQWDNVTGRYQPPWDENWELDEKFFNKMEEWEKEHPESTFAKVIQKMDGIIKAGKPVLEHIPDSPFPARSVVLGLAHLLQLGREISSAKKEVYDFTMQVSTWFYTVEASLRVAPKKKFSSQAKKNLDAIRNLLNEICKWGWARLNDRRWMSIGNGLFISGEIKLFKEKLTEARDLFSMMRDIDVAMGVDEILTEVLTIKRYMKGQFGKILDHLIEKELSEERRLYLERTLNPDIALRRTAYDDQGKPPCDEDSRIDIPADIATWVNDVSPGSRNFFWLTGDPGCGRSAITASLARYCKGAGTLWAQFFINRNDEATTNPKVFFPSIAYQLAQHSPNKIVEMAIYDILEANPCLLDGMSLDQAQILFVQVVQVACDLDKGKPVVIVIDGLDEISRKSLRDTATTFSKLFNKVKRPNAKVFIASRTNDEITKPFYQSLQANKKHVVHLHLDTSDPSSIEDVSRYLSRNLEKEDNLKGTLDRESSDDEGGDSTFYDVVRGYVGHATGPGNVIALKGSRLKPIHRKNPLDDSYEGSTSGRRNKVQASKGNMQLGVLTPVARTIENQRAPEPQEATTCWIAAEHALNHVRSRLSEVSEVFKRWKIQESEYIVQAGFDESLIKSGVGYLEQIHVFVSAPVDPKSPLLSELGRLFSPFSSILFTESSSYHLAVSKDDGNIWEFAELVYSTASKFADGGSTSKMPLIVVSLAQTPNNPAGFSQGGSGSGEGEKNEKQRSEKGKERDGGDEDEADKGDENDEDPPDDPGRPSANKASARLPEISFETNSEIYLDQDEQNAFQTLTMQGILTIKTTPVQRRQFSTRDVRFTALTFGTEPPTTDIAYKQLYVRVVVNSQQETARIEGVMPKRSLDSDGKEKQSSSTKRGRNYGLTGTATLLPAATVTGMKTNEETAGSEKMRYTSRITEHHSKGIVRWGFHVDDVNLRKGGIDMPDDHLPTVHFKFLGDSDEPAPPPECMDIVIASHWSMILPIEQKGSWIRRYLRLFSGNPWAISYSNLFQIVALKTVPSKLPKLSPYNATLEVRPGDPDFPAPEVKRRPAGSVVVTPAVVDDLNKLNDLGIARFGLSDNCIPTLMKVDNDIKSH